jgi:hypothetical protein
MAIGKKMEVKRRNAFSPERTVVRPSGSPIAFTFYDLGVCVGEQAEERFILRCNAGCKLRRPIDFEILFKPHERSSLFVSTRSGESYGFALRRPLPRKLGAAD